MRLIRRVGRLNEMQFIFCVDRTGEKREDLSRFGLVARIGAALAHLYVLKYKSILLRNLAMNNVALISLFFRGL